MAQKQARGAKEERRSKRSSSSGRSQSVVKRPARKTAAKKAAAKKVAAKKPVARKVGAQRGAAKKPTRVQRVKAKKPAATLRRGVAAERARARKAPVERVEVGRVGRAPVAKPVRERTARPAAVSPSAGAGFTVFLDVSNLCREGNAADLTRLDAAMLALSQKLPGCTMRPVADANLRYRLDSVQRAIYERRLGEKSVVEVPGSVRADAQILLLMAKYPRSLVLTNDGFREERERGETPDDLDARQLRFTFDEDGECLLFPPRRP